RNQRPRKAVRQSRQVIVRAGAGRLRARACQCAVREAVGARELIERQGAAPPVLDEAREFPTCITDIVEIAPTPYGRTRTTARARLLGSDQALDATDETRGDRSSRIAFEIDGSAANRSFADRQRAGVVSQRICRDGGPRYPQRQRSREDQAGAIQSYTRHDLMEAVASAGPALAFAQV